MEGWICPRCQQCYSPFVQKCDFCLPPVITISSTAICPKCGKSRYDAPSIGCGYEHYGTYSFPSE